MHVTGGNSRKAAPPIGSPSFWFDYLPWRPMLAEALDPRFHTIQYLDGLVWSGRARVFTNEHAAILAEIKVYPTGACDVHGLLAAGDLEAIVELIPQAEAWGREMGCIGGIIESRPGWQRVLKDQGYAPHQIAVRKEL